MINNFIYLGNVEKIFFKSKEIGISIVVIVVLVFVFFIISCLVFLIFAGIKRNLLNKIVDKMFCFNEEGFFMLIK